MKLLNLARCSPWLLLVVVPLFVNEASAQVPVFPDPSAAPSNESQGGVSPSTAGPEVRAPESRALDASAAAPAAEAPAPAPLPVESSFAAPANSSAQDTALATTPPAAAGSRHRMVWRYPKFRWWEWVAAGAVAVGNVSLELAYQAEPDDRWTTPVLVDAPLRDWLRATTRPQQKRLGAISDYLWYGTQWYVLADSLLTPLATDKFNTNVALQLTLLNWQTVGLAGLVARLTHVAVGRTRPSLQGCSDDPDAVNKCEFRGASFVAGHAMMTATSAGLGCANHYYLPMYGGGIADALVCPVLVSSALTVGVLRIAADKHWLSDTLAGWALGGGIGFGLPWLLHYGPHQVRTALAPLPNTVLLPWVDESTTGLQFGGAL